MILKQPRKGVLQEVSVEAADKPAPWLVGPSVAALPMLEFKPFDTLRDSQVSSDASAIQRWTAK